MNDGAPIPAEGLEPLADAASEGEDLGPVEDRIARLTRGIEEAVAEGELDLACHRSIRLGESFEEADERLNAETAYRHAVVLAREVDAADPELVLTAFTLLSRVLAPSEESVALARELSANVVHREEMYHPMRAAEAMHHEAIVTFQLAGTDPSHVSRALEVAEEAVRSCHGVCFHDLAQDLQRQAAVMLAGLGRNAEADWWNAEADRWQAKDDPYADWLGMWDLEIPGHVHLWNVRGDAFDVAGDETW